MKLRITVAILLTLLLGELGWLYGSLTGEYDTAAVRASQEETWIRQRTEEVDARQNQLDNLQSDEILAIEQETSRLNEEIALMEQQKKQVLAEVEDLQSQKEEKSEEYAKVEDDLSHYEQMCSELEKGIEKVKGYMAGD